MSKGTEKSSFFEKLATVIVDKRNLIFFLYACALIFCLFSRNWVSVCNDITEYLPETTETRQGLTLMEEEFTTFGTARVMVSHVTYEIAEELAEQMEQIEGVTSATFGSSTVGADTGGDGEPETPEDITEYFKGADALISVTFDGEEEDETSLAALAAIRESNGLAVCVTDEEILAAQRLLGRTCGVFGEPAGVTGAAALKKACEQGLIEKDATVVSVVTGNGLKDVANAIKSAGEPLHIEPDLDLMVRGFAERGVTVE